MKKSLPVIVLTTLTLGCVTLPARYTYYPSTSDGVQCKGSCTRMYQDCKDTALDKCIAWSGVRCTESAPASRSDMERCIAEEERCLKVCESS